jgi:phosphoserine aminotransferase
MSEAQKPSKKTNSPFFSSGPCKKRPGWNIDVLKNAEMGRSHRAKDAKGKLNEIITQTKELLNVPDDYLVGIVPASDTGAMELAMWNLLGERGVDVFSWEAFSKDWAVDARDQLKLKDLRLFESDYGKLPDLKEYDSKRDTVFAYNGTTSGVKVPDLNWIEESREGLTICDSTSAIFAFEMDWKKLDVTTFSWQKVMGSEAAHGMIILSPRAIKRFENYVPDRALPKIFRVTKKGKINKGIFAGATINTPSMLAVEDALDSLKWIKSIGGNKGMVERSLKNLKVVSEWVKKTSWVEFLAEDEKTISSTSICLKIVDERYLQLDVDGQGAFVKKIVKELEEENVAYDIASYRDAPNGIRIWGGGTVDSIDIEILTAWLDYAFGKFISEV